MDVGLRVREIWVPPRSLGVALDGEEHGTTWWWVLICIMAKADN